MTASKGLSAREERFCDVYLRTGNATEAARAAGSSAKSATSRGYTLLTMPHIAARIARMQDHLAEALGVTRFTLANELKKIALADITHTRSGWMELTQWEALPEDVRGCIESVTHDKRWLGGKMVDVVNVKFYNKLEAIRQLNDMLGFNAAKQVRVSDAEGGPLKVVHEVVFKDFSQRGSHGNGNGSPKL